MLLWGSISPWGAPAWECPFHPKHETKKSGRRMGSEPKASDGSWCTCQRLPLTFPSRDRTGGVCVMDTVGQAGRPSEGQNPPWGRLCRSSATHLQHPSGKRSSWCLLPGAMKSAPREGPWVFLIPNLRHSEKRTETRAPFRALWCPVQRPRAARQLDFVCFSPCLMLEQVFPRWVACKIPVGIAKFTPKPNKN